MSFPFGGRSTFRDRSMDKSGNEIIDDMLKNIKQRKKEFFESPPKWRSRGMFDDDIGSAGGSRLKAHLGDIAARHPELADHFFDLLPDDKKPPGTVPRGKSHEKKNTSQNKDLRTEVNNHPQTTTTGTQTGGLESDIKLRSTVPDMQASSGESVTDGDRGQRSQSAPPQTPVPNKQQTSEGIRLIPIRTDPLPSAPFVRPAQQNFQQQTPPQHYQQNFQQPPSHPQQQHSADQSRQEESKGPVVRHIPIFVEGRDEPLLPKDAGPSSTGMKRGGCQGKTEPAPSKRGPPSDDNKHHQQQPQQQQPQQQYYQQQQHHPQQQQNHEHHNHTQQQTQQQHTPTPPPPPPQKQDPLAQVGEVAKEVEALSSRVNEWNGSSRAEKEYIYLDEMLTRNLLKLDNIETEGKEEIRNARKETIRRIQALINILESKTSSEKSSQDCQQGSEESSMNTDAEEKQIPTEAMEVDNANPVPQNNSQNGNNASQNT